MGLAVFILLAPYLFDPVGRRSVSLMLPGAGGIRDALTKYVYI